MLLGKIVVSLIHLIFIGLGFTSNDHHVVHETVIVLHALNVFILHASDTIQTSLMNRQARQTRTENTAPFGVNLMRSQVSYQAAQGTDRQTMLPNARQIMLCFGSLCSSSSNRSGYSIPATRSATINKLLRKLWEPEPEVVPK